MTDNAPTKKPSMLDRLREFMDSLGSEEVESEEIPEGSGTEGDGTEGDGTEGDGTEGDGTEGDGTEGDGTEGVEGNAELDDLRAQIIDQAALIETLRNTIAELGGIDPTAEAELEVEPVSDTPSEDEIVAAFDEDYAKQEAMLAELMKES